MSTDIIMDKIVYEFYRKKIILRGKFELKSGQTSDIYINCRRISEFPSLMKLISNELEKAGIKILGTSVDAIDLAEDRDRFQKLVKSQIFQIDFFLKFRHLFNLIYGLSLPDLEFYRSSFRYSLAIFNS